VCPYSSRNSSVAMCWHEQRKSSMGTHDIMNRKTVPSTRSIGISTKSVSDSRKTPDCWIRRGSSSRYKDCASNHHVRRSWLIFLWICWIDRRHEKDYCEIRKNVPLGLCRAIQDRVTHFGRSLALCRKVNWVISAIVGLSDSLGNSFRLASLSHDQFCIPSPR
jgi:hypothetical protein